MNLGLNKNLSRAVNCNGRGKIHPHYKILSSRDNSIIETELCIVSHHKSQRSLLFKIAPVVSDNLEVVTPGPQTSPDDGSPGDELYVIGSEFISRVTSPGPPVSPSPVARSQCPGVTGSSGQRRHHPVSHQARLHSPPGAGQYHKG